MNGQVQKENFLSSISQALGDNPELLGSLAGAAFEGLIGGNVGIGAQQGLMGAQNIIQKQPERRSAKRL